MVHLKDLRGILRCQQVAGTYYVTTKTRLLKVQAINTLLPSTSRAEKKFRSITKSITEELRGAILSGKLAPGERFSEEKQAASMKVSRVPRRDALRRLEAEGYVTFMSHGEIAVSKPTLNEVENHYSIAGALEGLAARLAVQRVNAEETSRLRELHRALKEAYQARDLQRYFNANSKFHGFIAEMAGNEPLRRLNQEVRQEIRKSRILVLQLPQRLDYSMREHDQILDSFLKKNSELAQSLGIKAFKQSNDGDKDGAPVRGGRRSSVVSKSFPLLPVITFQFGKCRRFALLFGNRQSSTAQRAKGPKLDC